MSAALVVWTLAVVLFVAAAVLLLLARRELDECLDILDRAKRLHATTEAIFDRGVES